MRNHCGNFAKKVIVCEFVYIPRPVFFFFINSFARKFNVAEWDGTDCKIDLMISAASMCFGSCGTN